MLYYILSSHRSIDLIYLIKTFIVNMEYIQQGAIKAMYD